MAAAAAAVRIADWVEEACSFAVLRLNCLGLHQLPPLPWDLQQLHVCGNNLTCLGPHALPPGLLHLMCDHNQLTTLGPHPLPITLRTLSCTHNQLTGSLGPLPAGLLVLYCSDNGLCQLALPSGLEWLACERNSVAMRLHALPRSLTTLSCDCAPPLPNFPTGLTSLSYFGRGQLTRPLPPGLQRLSGRAVAAFAACTPPVTLSVVYFDDVAGPWKAAWRYGDSRTRCIAAAALPAAVLLFI